MWIYLKNNWVLFILKMSGSRGSTFTYTSKPIRVDFIILAMFGDKYFFYDAAPVTVI